jgi:hypothetical protein
MTGIRLLDMSEDRKKPGVAFWATVLVVVMLLYPLSFGPACWITTHAGVGASVVSTAYQPLLQVTFYGRRSPAAQMLRGYAFLFAAPGWAIGRYGVGGPCGLIQLPKR